VNCKVAASTKQAELNADHGARLVNLEIRDAAQNGKFDALAETVSGIRVDLAALPGTILGQMNSTMAKVALGIIVGLIANALAWWYKP